MRIAPAPRKNPQELQDRVVRLLVDARKEATELSLNTAVVRIGRRIGVKGERDTLRGSMKQAVIDAGERPGTTSSDAAWIKQLEAGPQVEAGERDPAGCLLAVWELDPALPW